MLLKDKTVSVSLTSHRLDFVARTAIAIRSIRVRVIILLSTLLDGRLEVLHLFVEKTDSAKDLLLLGVRAI